ncbi:MAG: hypothetical protein GH151_06710 [Bacteroidetes bacterium]|nr:hypothetical protein [Bacteroidota bacterium]
MAWDDAGDLMKSTSLTVRISIFSESETGTLQWEETHSATTNEFGLFSLQIGVIAQEIESVIPEVVKTNDEGYKLVDYSKLTVVLIEVMKEQQKMIEELQEKNRELQQLKKEIEELKMGLGLAGND